MVVSGLSPRRRRPRVWSAVLRARFGLSTALRHDRLWLRLQTEPYCVPSPVRIGDAPLLNGLAGRIELGYRTVAVQNQLAAFGDFDLPASKPGS
jgi:hypothetical protein